MIYVTFQCSKNSIYHFEQFRLGLLAMVTIVAEKEEGKGGQYSILLFYALLEMWVSD